MSTTHRRRDDGCTHIPSPPAPAVVYKLTHSSGHYYIGSSGNLKNRIIEHKWTLNNGTHHNTRLQELYLTSKEIIFEVLHKCTREEALKLEQKIINDNRNDPLMVNICMDTTAPMRGLKFGAMHRSRISKALTGRYVDDNWRKKLSDAKRGTRQSENTKQKRISSLKKVVHDEEWNRKAIENMIATKGAKISIDGVIYPCITNAARALGITPKMISHRLGSRNPDYAGWVRLKKEVDDVQAA